MFKTYETAREIIDCLVDFHYRAAKLAEKGMDIDQEERVALAFNFLYDHHLRMQEALATYETEGEKSVLDTYIPYELNASEAPEEFIESLECSENMIFEAVAKLAKQLADYIVGLLDGICSEISAPHVQEVFENILVMEQEELKLLIRGLNSLRDY